MSDSQHSIPRGNGEVGICEIIKATLETYNFRIITAIDGIEAIALLPLYVIIITDNFCLPDKKNQQHPLLTELLILSDSVCKLW
ncbi:MAG: hypothetical protein AAFW70_04405 [Cyanobacteria bacterium J06635_10]